MDLAGPGSRALFTRSLKVSPGGVHSPVRAFQAVGGSPLFLERGQGPYVWDVDGRRYIDYVMSWGALPLGHGPLPVVEAIRRRAQLGTTFGAPCREEVELAETILEAFPAMDEVRFVSSGTEALMSALRLARAYTGRSKFLKFRGCYHGHADPFLVEAGSGALTLGQPSSPGVPPEAVAPTLLADYNDVEGVETLFRRYGDELAAVVVEPVAANMGLVPPAPGFLDLLRSLTAQHGALLIFDEVITGFRLAWGGAQGYYGIKPDLTAWGKIIGGGLPVGAYGGKREIMELISPAGPVYQAGTLSGNPLAMAAGLATLRLLQKENPYPRWEETARNVVEAFNAARPLLLEGGLEPPLQVRRIGTLVGLSFAPQPPRDSTSAMAVDSRLYAAFFQALLAEGVYLPPSPYEILFVSPVHNKEIQTLTEMAVRQAARRLLKERRS
ncbi:MAG: glutamate-1-semialdehyde 2,1-aminomutase [Bacillota bacterium]|nr:glutamate-1-semialdehyde 2,1-aminomutase [Bacillota bacterium]